jgi:phage N-6-adenine-methyltransferase
MKLADACGSEVGARSLPAGEHFGARLMILRKRQELGRRAVAALADLSPTTVAAIEGGADCHTAAAFRLAEALGARLQMGAVGVSTSFWEAAATSSVHHGWHTPPALLDALYPVVGGLFDLDPCSPVRRGSGAPVRALTRFTAEDDALARPWRAGTVFMNPPYGRELGYWVAKAKQECLSGRAGLVLGLVPARTDTRWWHDSIAEVADVWMLKGRLAFGDGAVPAPFPSAIVVWGADDEQRLGLTLALPTAWHVPRASQARDPSTSDTP